MKTKKLSFYIFLAAAFCVIYTIFAIRPLNSEYQFSPEWKIDVSNPIEKDTALAGSARLLHFKLGQSMGYFTPGGKPVHYITYPYKASISDFYYTAYSADNETAAIFSPDGTQAGIIKEAGFVKIYGKKIFVFLPGGNSFAQYAPDGEKLWDYGGPAPITAFSSTDIGTAAGFADGTVCVFAPDGTLVIRFSPGGSDIPVILGLALSPDGKHVAGVSGQNRQRFVLARIENAKAKIVMHEFLDKYDAEQKMVAFSADGKTVYYGAKNMLGVADVEKGVSAHLKIDGQAISVQETDQCAFVLTKSAGTYTVYAVEKFATLLGRFAFTADTAFIETDGSKLYVGRNAAVSCIGITKK